jgi:hypothetical protein
MKKCVMKNAIDTELSKLCYLAWTIAIYPAKWKACLDLAEKLGEAREPGLHPHSRQLRTALRDARAAFRAYHRESPFRVAEKLASSRHSHTRYFGGQLAFRLKDQAGLERAS